MDDTDEIWELATRAPLTVIKAQIDEQVDEARRKGLTVFTMPAKDIVVPDILSEYVSQMPFPLDNERLIKWLIKLYAEDNVRAYQEGAMFHIDM